MTERDHSNNDSDELDAIDELMLQIYEVHLESLPEGERAVKIAENNLFVDSMVQKVTKGLGPTEGRLLDGLIGGLRIKEALAVEFDKPMRVIDRLERRVIYKVNRTIKDSDS